MRNKIEIITTVIILNFCFTMPRTSYAQDGSLDLNFDGDGIVSTDIGSNGNVAYAVAIQPDGKIVIGGANVGATGVDFALIRYNPNGSLDNTFDSDGIAITQVGTNNDNAYSIVLQADGKILVGGLGYNGLDQDFTIIRYTTTGSLDTTFDGDGMVFTDFATYDDWGRALAIQADGKIVMTGYSFSGSNLDIALSRHNSDGSLDTTFDTDGKALTPVGLYDDWGNSVAIQDDGRILVAGYTLNGINMDIVIVRYNTNGSLDTTFDSDGIVTTDIGNFENRAHSVAIQADGKIVVAGFAENGISSDYALVRYNTNGSLDGTFDGDGIVTTDIANFTDEVNSLIIQSDGKIITAGYSVNSSYFELSIAKYNINGSLDNTFDSDGKVTTNLGSYYSYAYAVAQQPDGKIVAAGSAQLGFTSDDFIVARYHNTISTGINTSAHQNVEINLYPNPFSNQATLQSEINLQNATLTIYNSFGVQVEKMENLNGYSVTISRSDLASGLYCIRLAEENKTIAEYKLVVNQW